MTPSEVTALLSAWGGGDRAALDRLMPLVYEDLRRIAGNQLKAERRDHTLSATAVVHEVYLRLLGQRAENLGQRAQFFALAAGMIRRVLVDHARRRVAAKRGGETIRLQLDENLAQAAALPGAAPDLDVLALDAALEELQAQDPRLGRIVELRIFGGLSLDETIEEMQLSRATITREWALAKSWLHRRLSGAAPPSR